MGWPTLLKTDGFLLTYLIMSTAALGRAASPWAPGAATLELVSGEASGADEHCRGWHPVSPMSAGAQRWVCCCGERVEMCCQPLLLGEGQEGAETGEDAH